MEVIASRVELSTDLEGKILYSKRRRRWSWEYWKGNKDGHFCVHERYFYIIKNAQIEEGEESDIEQFLQDFMADSPEATVCLKCMRRQEKKKKKKGNLALYIFFSTQRERRTVDQ